MTGLLERAKELRLKHLQGQHDQGAHAHGGSAGRAVPAHVREFHQEINGRAKEIAKRHGLSDALEGVYLIGSQAKGTAQPHSDVDFLVKTVPFHEYHAKRGGDRKSLLNKWEAMELEMDALATKQGGRKYEVFVTDDVEGVTLSLDQYKETAVTFKEMGDVPNYHRVGQASLQRCATCRHFTESGRCDLYDFKADEQYTCDSWRPNIEALRAARSQTTKEVSATPTATYAHGPGGLFSPAGLSGDGSGKRKHGVVETAVTTKPGDKYRSIKNPKVYEALIRKGMPKSQAAAISNAMAKRGKKEYSESEKEKFDKASTQLNMPNAIKGKALQFARSIDKDDLHEYGVERDTHVTVKYGIANNTLERVKQIASRFGPITLKFGRVSLFKRPEEGFDVVKVEVESPELVALNRAIGALPNADTRKGYNPHLTIAYVKSGTGKKYTGNGPLMGNTVVVDTLQFSDKDGNKTTVKLAGEVQAETTKHLGGSHNQAVHGYRFGKAPSTEQARKYRKAGVLQDYIGRARQRSGTKPSKDRQAEKPRLNPLPNGKDDVAKIAKSKRADMLTFENKKGDSAVISINRPKKGHAEVKVFKKDGTSQRQTFPLTQKSITDLFKQMVDANSGWGLIYNSIVQEKEWHTATQSTTATDRLQRAKELAGRVGGTGGTAAAVTTTKQTETTPATATALKHLTHNQASHGFRFGRTPSLEQARRYRKAGVLQEYSKRSRGRSGTKPAKERNAAKPKKPKETVYKRGDTVEVTNRYGGLLPGMRGKVVSYWKDPYGVGRVRLDMGANLSGQRLRQTIPTNSIKPAEATKEAKSPPSTFTVFKDKTGRYRWVAISSTAYRDRDGEIVSTKALSDDVARADSTGNYGPLRWWHVPGLDLGDTDFNMVYGRSLIESGTFKSDRIAERVKEKAHLLRLSLGFRHPADEPDKSGVFHTIRRFERSLIPPDGNASNLFTSLVVT